MSYMSLLGHIILKRPNSCYARLSISERRAII